MDRFEFFFGIYSLLLGFALAELMLGYANLLRAPVRPKWGLLTPTLGLLIFLEIMVTFLDAWIKLQTVSLTLFGLLTPTLIAMAFFAAAVMAVPRRAGDWETLDDYFHDRKKWLLGFLIFQLLITILVIEAPGMIRAVPVIGWTALHTEWVIANIIFLTLHAAPLFSRRRLANLLPMVGIIFFLFYYYGSFNEPAATAQAHAPAPSAASGTPPGSPPPAPAK